jgi:hypothetical protein
MPKLNLKHLKFDVWNNFECLTFEKHGWTFYFDVRLWELDGFYRHTTYQEQRPAERDTGVTHIDWQTGRRLREDSTQNSVKWLGIWLLY